MSDNQKLNVTQKELLIRLDERVRALQDQVTMMQSQLIPPSEHDSLMSTVKELDGRTTKLENFNSRLAGLVIGAGAGAGGLAGIIFQAVTGALQ